MFAVLVVAFPIRKNLIFKNSVYFVWGEDFIKENFITLCVFFCLAALKNTILVWSV